MATVCLPDDHSSRASSLTSAVSRVVPTHFVKLSWHAKDAKSIKEHISSWLTASVKFSFFYYIHMCVYSDVFHWKN